LRLAIFSWSSPGHHWLRCWGKRAENGPSGLTLTHPHPLNQSTHPLRAHFWPLASEVEIGSHDSVGPELRPGEGESTLNITPDLSFLISPSRFSPSTISFLLAIVDYSRSSSHPLLLRSYHWLFAVNLTFSLSFVSFTSVIGSKTRRGGVPTKGGGEWLGTGGS
jgi:hypothetical protein